jgi:hypothetical protein
MELPRMRFHGKLLLHHLLQARAKLSIQKSDPRTESSSATEYIIREIKRRSEILLQIIERAMSLRGTSILLDIFCSLSPACRLLILVHTYALEHAVTKYNLPARGLERSNIARQSDGKNYGKDQHTDVVGDHIG